MNRKTRLIAASAAALIAAGIPSVLVQKEARAQTVNPSDQASEALSYFASEVETLGVENYPNSFAGAELTSSGVTEAYLTSPSNSALVAAINSLDTSGYPVSFVNVSRSYNQLDALAASVTAKDDQLMSDGIYLTQTIPQPVTGTVSVNIKEPTASSMSALASTRGRSVTSTNYSASVDSVLQQMFGSSVTQGLETSASLVPVDRNADTSPFYNGDLIYNPSTKTSCTGGWNVLNNHNADFMVSAGHCGTASLWYAGTALYDAPIGPTSSNWFSSSSTKPYPTVLDAQAIKIDSSNGGLGYVWTDYGNNEPVTGTLIPAVGSSPTINGAKTGETHGTVTAVDVINDNVCDQTTGKCSNNVHQFYETNNVNSPLCVNGDSGGPAYQQYGSTNPYAKAEGVIDSAGYFTQGGTIVGWECDMTLITAILGDKSLTLITG